MIYDPPKLEGETIEEYLASARKIVRWGEDNLAEVRRVMAMDAREGLQMHESQQLLAAALITINCDYFNRLIEAELNKPVVVHLPDHSMLKEIKA